MPKSPLKNQKKPFASGASKGFRDLSQQLNRCRESGIAFLYFIISAMPGRTSHSKKGATTQGCTAGTTATLFPND
jgi:hypothetical protein